MITLPDGRFAVRDDVGIQLFDDDGTFLKHIGEGVIGRCFGLTHNGRVSLSATDSLGIHMYVSILDHL